MSPAAHAAGYFEALFQHAPFGYVVTDNDDVVVRVNETLLGWGRYEVQRVVGRPFRDLLTPGSQLLYETRHLPVLGLQGFAHEVFLQLQTAAGVPLPVLINAARVLDADGDPHEVRIGVLDASNRVSYERELLTTKRNAESLAARISVLQNASAAFADSNTEVQVAQSLSSIAEDALVATAACVAVPRDGGRLEVIAGTNPLDGLIVNDTQVLGFAVLESERPVIVGTTDDDLSSYPAVVTAMREARLHTLAVFPIMSDTTPVGVIAVFFARERTVADNEADMVLSLSRQASQVITRVRAQEQIAHAARHDPLTGLVNRASLRAAIGTALLPDARPAAPLSVMFLDLDGFKAVNDRLGHNVGDVILREVAARLTASVRSADLVGRYGGDEFVVVCDDTAGAEAEAVAERIHATMREPFEAAQGLPLSASIGIVTHESSVASASADDIIGAADQAMYDSKRLGRDRTTHARL
ncbi:diguanylate cyclase [Conyzicola sp.]|uniref:diguanylate cyclase n=1 Tax=Conyzicola sp. TaxID=1969404 RepID=UPI003989E8DF